MFEDTLTGDNAKFKKTTSQVIENNRIIALTVEIPPIGALANFEKQALIIPKNGVIKTCSYYPNETAAAAGVGQGRGLNWGISSGSPDIQALGYIDLGLAKTKNVEEIALESNCNFEYECLSGDVLTVYSNPEGENGFAVNGGLLFIILDTLPSE